MDESIVPDESARVVVPIVKDLIERGCNQAEITGKESLPCAALNLPALKYKNKI